MQNKQFIKKNRTAIAIVILVFSLIFSQMPITSFADSEMGDFTLTATKSPFTTDDTVSFSWTTSANAGAYQYIVYEENGDILCRGTKATENIAYIGRAQVGRYTIEVTALKSETERTNPGPSRTITIEVVELGADDPVSSYLFETRTNKTQYGSNEDILVSWPHLKGADYYLALIRNADDRAVVARKFPVYDNSVNIGKLFSGTYKAGVTAVTHAYENGEFAGQLSTLAGEVEIRVVGASAGRSAYVSNTGYAKLNLRDEDGEIIGQIPGDAVVTITANPIEGQTYPISYQGKTGYVDGRYLTEIKPGSKDEPNLLKGYYRVNNPLFEGVGGRGGCNWYAWGRAYEITGQKFPYLEGDITEAWYNGLDWPKGQEPKANSIAVWTGDPLGHYAFVEKVEGDFVTISDANEGGDLKYRGKSKFSYKALLGLKEFDHGELLGFIYAK